jgi:peptidoglycan/xylan/chitin deacetylase (PgdA/CDA1 family)/folate-dependent phosphoribosylglycinamide formyltransferase PurN
MHTEASPARVCGVLYERRPPKTGAQRFKMWRKKIGQPGYLRYVFHRVWDMAGERMLSMGEALLRVMQAAPRYPNGTPDDSLNLLRERCKQTGTQVLVTADVHSAEALAFVRGLDADLGLVYGTGILKPELFTIPKQGSINIHKRKVPDYRGGGPIGLWEMLDGQSEIGVTVHRVEAKVDVGSVIREATIPIDPYDNLGSLSLKADVVGNDLIVAAVRDFGNGTVHEKPQTGPGKTYRRPSPETMQEYEKRLADERSAFPPVYGRQRWKLLLKSALFALPLTARNWRRRLRGEFPVMILYHHVVSDRPHRMGVGTNYFLRQVNYLKRHYRLVSLAEAVQLAKAGPVRTPTVAITFDDGYADNYINLRAVTEAADVPACFFISTQYISSDKEFFHDQRANDPGFLPCTWEQIRELQQSGIEIGSHTRNHADCGSTDPEFLQSEIQGSREDLQQKLGMAIPFFSFPFGRPANISTPAIEVAQESFPYVFSAFGGSNFPSSERRVLKRCPFPLNLWELELQVQCVLERGDN